MAFAHLGPWPSRPPRAAAPPTRSSRPGAAGSCTLGAGAPAGPHTARHTCGVGPQVRRGAGVFASFALVAWRCGDTGAWGHCPLGILHHGRYTRSRSEHVTSQLDTSCRYPPGLQPRPQRCVQVLLLPRRNTPPLSSNPPKAHTVLASQRTHLASSPGRTTASRCCCCSPSSRALCAKPHDSCAMQPPEEMTPSALSRSSSEGAAWIHLGRWGRCWGMGWKQGALLSVHDSYKPNLARCSWLLSAAVAVPTASKPADPP